MTTKMKQVTVTTGFAESGEQQTVTVSIPANCVLMSTESVCHSGLAMLNLAEQGIDVRTLPVTYYRKGNWNYSNPMKEPSIVTLTRDSNKQNIPLTNPDAMAGFIAVAINSQVWYQGKLAEIAEKTASVQTPTNPPSPLAQAQANADAIVASKTAKTPIGLRFTVGLPGKSAGFVVKHMQKSGLYRCHFSGGLKSAVEAGLTLAYGKWGIEIVKVLENGHINARITESTPAVQTPAVQTPAVQTPAVQTPAVDATNARMDALESKLDLLLTAMLASKA